MTWWAWMILGAVLLGAELFAVDAQFYLVFLGVSAAVVGLGVLFGITMPEWVQWLAFAVISVIFFVTFRKALYVKLRSGGQGYEQQVDARLKAWREAQRKALGITETESLPDLDDQQVQTIKRRHKPTGGKSE